MCPIVSTDIPRDKYLRYFCKDKYLKPVYVTLLADGLYSENYGVFAQQAKDNVRIMALVCTCIRSTFTSLEKSFRATMNKHVGMSCMTRFQTSNLMWGHYADSHRGTCVGYSFDYSNIVLIENKAIDYRNSKVSLPAYVLELPDKERIPLYIEVAFSKAQEWSYEKEHRFLAELDHCKKENRDGTTYYYQELDKRDIKELILGVRCQHESEFRDVISQQHMNLLVSKCVQEGSSFALSIIPTT